MNPATYYGCRVCPIDNKSGMKLVPLRSVSVESRCFDFSTEVVITQRYQLPPSRDETPQTLDCSYSFPLDENSCVTGFQATIEGKVLVGVVKEKEQAKAEFKAAKKAGQQALLLEQHKVNEFTMQIGLLQPGQEVEVKITYVTTLDLEGPTTNRFVLPMQIAPKYTPNLYYGYSPAAAVVESSTDFNFFKQMTAKAEVLSESASSSSQSRGSDMHSFFAPPKLDVKALFYMPIVITSVSSPSHPGLIKVEQEVLGADAHLATVTLQLDESWNGRYVLERDLVLLVKLSEFQMTRSMVEHDPVTGEQTVQVAFCPESFNAEMDASSLQVEMLFLIDESGSMGGSSIAAVRDTLQLFLRSLPVRSKFNLISFGSTYRTLFPKSREYSDESLSIASEHVKHLSADLGGTEIFDPLAYCLSAELDPEYPRQIFVLTDGQVSNSSQIVSLARQFCSAGQNSFTRIYTFGVGGGVDRALVKDLAHAGGGHCEFVGEGGPTQSKELNEKVMRQLIRSLTPSLTDVKIEWEGLLAQGASALEHSVPAPSSLVSSKCEQYPRTLPPLYAQNRSMVYCCLNLPLDDRSVRTLKISGITNRRKVGDVVNGGRQQWTCQVNLARRQSGSFLSKLAARARVGELQRGGVTSQAVKEEIIHLGLSKQIATNFTSFLIVDPESDKIRREKLYELRAKELELQRARREAHEQQAVLGKLNKEAAVAIFGEAVPVVIDAGSANTRAGLVGDDEPTSFRTLIGRPRHRGIMVGMGQKDCYVGEEALSKRGLVKVASASDSDDDDGYIAVASSSPSACAPAKLSFNPPSGTGPNTASPHPMLPLSAPVGSSQSVMSNLVYAVPPVSCPMEAVADPESFECAKSGRNSLLASIASAPKKLVQSGCDVMESLRSRLSLRKASLSGATSASAPQKKYDQQQVADGDDWDDEKPSGSLATGGFSIPTNMASSSSSAAVLPLPVASLTLDAAFQSLVQLQTATGYWPASAQFVALVQSHAALAQDADKKFFSSLTMAKISEFALHLGQSAEIVATLIALFLFDTIHAHRRSEVAMMIGKTKNVLNTVANIDIMAATATIRTN